MRIENEIFVGQLVRLSATDPDTDPQLFAKWDTDSEYRRLLDSDPPRLYSAKEIKEHIEKERPDRERADFMIHTLADDKCIGFCGLWLGNWHHGDAFLAIGIGDREYWGKGYGGDAVRAICRFGFLECGLHRISLGVFEYNTRAQATYRKVGFVEEGRQRGQMMRDGQRWDVIYMGLLRSEWSG